MFFVCSDTSDSSDGLGSALPCRPARAAGAVAQCDVRAIASPRVAPAIGSCPFAAPKRVGVRCAKTRRVSPSQSGGKTSASASAVCVRFGAAHTKQVVSAAPPAARVNSVVSVDIEAVPRAAHSSATRSVFNQNSSAVPRAVCPAPASAPDANRVARPTVRVLVHPHPSRTRTSSPAVATASPGPGPGPGHCPTLPGSSTRLESIAQVRSTTNGTCTRSLNPPDVRQLEPQLHRQLQNDRERQLMPTPPNMSNPPKR